MTIGRHLATIPLLLAALLTPAPLFAQAESCPAGTSATDDSINTVLLPALVKELNGAWAAAAQEKIDPLTNLPPVSGTASCPAIGYTACASTIVSPDCQHVTFNAQFDQLANLSQLVFSSIAENFYNVKDVAEHSARGPDAGTITDGIFAPEGDDWNAENYTVIPPQPNVGAALVIDLGSVLTICGGSCGPKVQADRHPFQFEYSTDGKSWTSYSQVPKTGADGLTTRVLAEKVSGTPNPDFQARYVRLYGIPDDDTNYSVSEVELRNTSNQIVSIGAPAIGPLPYQIFDGVAAVPDGAAWNDTTYAVVLRKNGVSSALGIDLGAPVKICGSSTCGPNVQADKNEYQFDYSSDGINWTSYAKLPTASADGLRTRRLAQNVPGTDNPDFTAQYIRMWGVPGSDGNFSISEIMLTNATTGEPIPVTQGTTFGPEPPATNGEVAPEGADWDDAAYARILSPCAQSSNTVCTNGSQIALTGALHIDLGDVFTLSGLTVQADRHQFQIDYRANESDAWQPLWKVPSVSGDGLLTRPNQSVSAQARYLIMYGTAGDDLNYSVSSVQVFSQVAKTPCPYSPADEGQSAAACSYDGTTTTKMTGPNSDGSVPITFTIVSADAYFHCTGTTSIDIPVPDGSIVGNTTCSANLQVDTAAAGQFCSVGCDAGTKTASALTYLALEPDLPKFTLTDLSCDHSTGNLTGPVETAVGDTAATAVQELFNGLVVTPLVNASTGKALPPMIPSGTCVAADPTPTNTRLTGSATHVGESGDAGRVRLAGAVRASGAGSLDTLALDLSRVLHEDGGVEELIRTSAGVPLVPLTLQPGDGSRADRARYATAPGVTPSVRAEVKKGARGRLKFKLDVQGATIPVTPTCSGRGRRVRLTTSFRLTDGANPVDVNASQNWRCDGKHRLVTSSR
jgi:hypothetical protein